MAGAGRARTPTATDLCVTGLPEKAKKELGWKAELGLDDMCADSWRWISASFPVQLLPAPPPSRRGSSSRSSRKLELCVR